MSLGVPVLRERDIGVSIQPNETRATAEPVQIIKGSQRHQTGSADGNHALGPALLELRLCIANAVQHRIKRLDSPPLRGNRSARRRDINRDERLARILREKIPHEPCPEGVGVQPAAQIIRIEKSNRLHALHSTRCAGLCQGECSGAA